jgi:hypothetical protein
MHKIGLLLLAVAVGCSSSDDDGINNDPGPDDFRGAGGEAGMGGAAGSAGVGGEPEKPPLIECPVGDAPDDAPFGFLTVCGCEEMDAPLCAPIVPFEAFFAGREGFRDTRGASWTFDRAGEIAMPLDLSVIFIRGRSPGASAGGLWCGGPPLTSDEERACNRVIIEEQRRSATFDSQFFSDVDGYDVAVSGTLYWE